MLQIAFLSYAIHRNDVHIGQEKYFRCMLNIIALSFVADIMSSFHNVPQSLFPFVAAGNYFEIILNTILIPIYYRYICDQIINLDLELRRRLSWVFWVWAAGCILLVVSTAFTGKIFYFDENNIYHRGEWFAIPMFVLFVMMVMVELFLIKQKNKIEAHYYNSMVLFMVFPLIGWALQLLIYGLPFSLIGITFSSLVLFTNIQNRNMDKDYLTGAFNRKALDHYMKLKINASTDQKTFSSILIDIDNFKSINDQFGHFEGDDALINVVWILRKSVDKSDFIARFGGDEFCIVLNSDDPKDVENAIHQINHSLLLFNENENKSYQLSFSMGYGIYKLEHGKGTDLFFKVIDKRMYEEKKYFKETDLREGIQK